MTPRTYASPEAFKQALEQRLRTTAKDVAKFWLTGSPTELLSKLREAARLDLDDFLTF